MSSSSSTTIAAAAADGEQSIVDALSSTSIASSSHNPSASASSSSASSSSSSSSSAPAIDLSSATDPDSSFESTERRRTDWYLPSSLAAQRTLNPIRAIVDQLVVPQGTGKSLIPLSIGDPTVFGNLHPPATAVAELSRLTLEGKSNGYAPSTGSAVARSAIARRFTSGCPYGELAPSEIMICSGASGALQIAMDACLDAGDNILLPQPGFSLYATIAGYLNVDVRYYPLDPDKNWECDLAAASKLVDSRTRAILVNNPSNPNGSNFTIAHLNAIVAFALDHQLLIISDEIYADMVFSGNIFTPIANLSPDVPIITIGGIAKQYVVPGWRIGWIMFHDRHGRLKVVRDAANMLTQVILGSNTLIQALLPSLLLDTPEEYYTTLNSTLESQALFLYTSINAIRGLTAIEPQGAMYLMVRIDASCFPPALADDVAFSKGLLAEEMLFVLPGSCFLAFGFVRLVTCAPKHILEVAVARMKSFCERHYVK